MLFLTPNPEKPLLDGNRTTQQCSYAGHSTFRPAKSASWREKDAFGRPDRCCGLHGSTVGLSDFHPVRVFRCLGSKKHSKSIVLQGMKRLWQNRRLHRQFCSFGLHQSTTLRKLCSRAGQKQVLAPQGPETAIEGSYAAGAVLQRLRCTGYAAGAMLQELCCTGIAAGGMPQDHG